MDYTRADFIWEESNVYHAQAADFLSSHQLTDYIQSPINYWYKRNVTKDKPEPASFFTGRAVHQLILEGEEVFNANYIVGGPINERTGKPYGTDTIKYREWLAENGAEGKAGLSETDYELIDTCRKSVTAHAIASGLLMVGFPEAVVRAEYMGTPCQIRIDWFNPAKGIVDLKTCRNIDRFHLDFNDYLYANQLSFYQEVFKARFGEKPEVFIIAAEVSEPYRTGVYRICDSTLSEARHQNEAFIPKFVESKTTGVYPTRYEDMRIL